MKEHLQKLYTQLDANRNHGLTMTVGMDGFIDEIYHLVDKRANIDEFERIPTLKEYGERVVRAAGLSTNVEMVPIETRLGGNGPYLSNALLNLGSKIFYIGALGNPVHPAYQEFSKRTEKFYSLCEPGISQAFEFDDGKLLMLKPDTFRGITWERVMELVGSPQALADMLDKSAMLGLIDWSIVYNMTGIWKHLLDEVFPLMAEREVKPLAFFDLSDPEKRSKEDILEAMKLIGKFEGKFRAILGLNEKELYQIADAFGVKAEGLKDNTVEVYKKMGIYCVVVHPVKEAACCIDGQYYEVEGPYCAKPMTTTGAGDNFNSGFSLGQALGLDPVSALYLGVCASGFFVRNARSGMYTELMGFAKQWAEDGSI